MIIRNARGPHCGPSSMKAERPFAVDAVVLMPDHLHAILTLPAGDTDYSAR